jgi:putative transposase
MSSLAQFQFNDKVLSEEWSQLKTSFWGDLTLQAANMLRRLLETTMELEVQDLIGSRHWEHNPTRPTYRNGYRTRSLLSSFGHLASIQIPRLREGRYSFSCLKRYRRRAPDVDLMILEMFLSGVSTRNVSEVLEPIYGSGAISAAGVSRISKNLNKYVNEFHSRRLSDDYLYLIADGVYFNVKNPVRKRRRCVLVVYGIKSTGQREIIDFQLAPLGESIAAWEKFLNQMYHRGFEGSALRLVVTDGCKASKAAFNTVYPMAKHQLCWAHKLRNVANKLPKQMQAVVVNEARDIYSAENGISAMKSFRHWVKVWGSVYPQAVNCLADDIYDLLNFYNEPESLWIKLRTTNIIERTFREVRRRTRPMSCFQNQDSVQRIIFAVFMRQNKQWEKKPLKITHFT